MRVKLGALYCAEHLTKSVEDSEEKRIPCPLDPAHSVYESRLKAHLKKCNARIPEVIPSYFSKDLNSQTDEDISRCACDGESKATSISDLVDRIENASKTQSLIVPIILERHKQIEKTNISEFEKHRLQQEALSSLILQKVISNKGKYDKIVICEFGAGKGGLSSFLWESFFLSSGIDCEFILIDRSNSRCKKDAKMRHEGAKVKRIFIDIKDLDLNNLLSEYEKERTYFLWISKHLCGTATCLTINSLAKLNGHLGTFCVALCCHQCCAWKAYPSKKFLIDIGLIKEKTEGERERAFRMLCSITSWAVCGFRDSSDSDSDSDEGADAITYGDDDIDSNSKRKRTKLHNGLVEPDHLVYSDDYKESIGRSLKRLLDHGRELKLKDALFSGTNCELKHYIEEEVTLENAVLVGHAR